METKTRRGRDKLFFEGYGYVKEKVARSGMTQFWRCDSLRREHCKGRLHSHIDPPYLHRKVVIPHVCSFRQSAETVNRAITHMKHVALTTPSKTADVIETLYDPLSVIEGAALPPRLSMKRTLQRTRAMAGKPRPPSSTNRVPPLGSNALSQFASAQSKLRTLTEDPGQATKLELYALFQQATTGENRSPRPRMMGYRGKTKWDAWKELGSMSKEEAMLKYATIVNDLLSLEQTQMEATETYYTSTDDIDTEEATFATEDNVFVKREGKIFVIQLNKPKTYNAITWEMYNEIGFALKESDADETTSVTVIQGTGDYFSSGHDLSNFDDMDPTDAQSLETFAENGRVVFQRFVDSFIDHQKPLIGLINGHAVGISVTILGLFDLVYASEKATFVTPNATVGQTPEGCSSYTFPRIMGDLRAKELLLFGRQVTAEEARERGLVAEVFPDDTFFSDVQPLVQHYSQLPPKALRMSKSMLVDEATRDRLHQVNAAESELLCQSWLGTEGQQAILDYRSACKPEPSPSI